MSRAVIIAAAGCSTRFNASLEKDILKVIYSEGKPKECLLGYQLELTINQEIDLIVIVGGYKYSDLCLFIKENYGDNSKIVLVYNDKFREYGTCYSFICGLNCLHDRDIDEVILMEGDLAFDRHTFKSLIMTDKDVITTNPDVIHADTSVVFYVTAGGVLHYIYDNQHKELCIKEPFIILGNSGQIWKFIDVTLLMNIIKNLGEELYYDTNLLPIEHYFKLRGMKCVKFINFEFWINCNTIKDYQNIRDMNKGKLYERH